MPGWHISLGYGGLVLRRIVLFAAPLLLLISACTQAPQTAPAGPTTGSATSSASTSSAGTPTSATPTISNSVTTQSRPVHVSLLEGDGGEYGVGMPIIAWFDVAPTDGAAFAKATTVTVNGKKVPGAWYFERTSHAGSALEAHYRPQSYWPGHARIQMDLPVQGLSAGPGLSFDDSLTLDMTTGPAIFATVNAGNLRMTVKSDGRLVGVYPVSLGAPNTRTMRGIKVIMEKGVDIPMRGPGYYDPHVQWTQRLTYGGEYLHSAPWNVANLGKRSTSNGCTNLSPTVAKGLYGLMRIGDVVSYPNANGSQMQLGSGYGDWNVSWGEWQTGGAVKTT
jgi:lipoprotein-anchoring transpeptidase ErfK/SrfK